MDWSLHHEDKPAWQSHLYYDHDIAHELGDIYDSLFERDGHEAIPPARLLELAQAKLPASCEPHQRLRLLYALARIYTSLGEYMNALERIDEGYGLAEALRDSSAMLELLTMRAATHMALLRFSEAEHDYDDALWMLHYHAPIMTRETCAFEVHLLVQLVNVTFFQSKLRTAQSNIFLAEGILAHTSGNMDASMALLFTKGVIARWLGRPEEAMRPILTAARHFQQSDHLATAARVQLSAADVLLDLLTTLASKGMDSVFILDQAASYMDFAASLADEARESDLADLTLLTRARHERLRGWPASQIPRIEQVIRRAESRHDKALLAQALTALAEELEG